MFIYSCIHSYLSCCLRHPAVRCSLFAVRCSCLLYSVVLSSPPCQQFRSSLGLPGSFMDCSTGICGGVPRSSPDWNWCPKSIVWIFGPFSWGYPENFRTKGPKDNLGTPLPSKKKFKSQATLCVRVCVCVRPMAAAITGRQNLSAGTACAGSKRNEMLALAKRAVRTRAQHVS
jgi:hypothetical protein